MIVRIAKKEDSSCVEIGDMVCTVQMGWIVMEDSCHHILLSILYPIYVWTLMMLMNWAKVTFALSCLHADDKQMTFVMGICQK